MRLSAVYPAAVRRAWAPDDIDAAAWQDRQSRHWTQVAVDADDRPLGFVELAGAAPTGHIDMLFVAPAAQGRGIAGALLAAAEAAARAHGVTRLTTEASHAARPVFQPPVSTRFIRAPCGGPASGCTTRRWPKTLPDGAEKAR